MKPPLLTRSSLALLCVVASILCLQPDGRAVEKIKPAKSVEPKKNHRGEVKSEAELLRDAYGILERADHDYKGHRRAAMHQIEEAAKQLGVKLHGDGKGHEQQAVSDGQLREAQTMLESARVVLAGHKNKKVLEHIEAAIKELGVALSIK